MHLVNVSNCDDDCQNVNCRYPTEDEQNDNSDYSDRFLLF